MRFISLFAGIGGMDLGLEQAGMYCVGQVEIADYPQSVLARHWPGVPKWQDIRDVSDLPPHDVMAGGFPCQDISFANRNGKGLSGKKSSLWWEFHRLIHQHRPSYAIIENVAAIRAAGRGLAVVLHSLAEIGYDAEWCVFRASDVGAPHKRARMWLVAYPHRHGEPTCPVYDEALLVPESGSDGWAWPAASERVRVADGLSDGLDRSRLTALGNAVCPRAAFVVGRAVMRHRQYRSRL